MRRSRWSRFNRCARVGFLLSVLTFVVSEILVRTKHHPPVGVYISLMGLIAAILAFFHLKQEEKATWILLMTLLVAAEIRNLYVVDREQAEVFSKISDSLTATRRGLDATAERLEQGIKFTTGGDSFVYLSFYAIDGDRAHLLAHQKGDYPLHGATATLSDHERYSEWYMQHNPLKAGDVFPGQHTYPLGDFPVFGAKQLGEFDLDKHGRQNFDVSFAAMNGYWAEFIALRRVKGKWLQAIRVLWQAGHAEGNETNFTLQPVFTYADPDYPRTNGQINWN